MIRHLFTSESVTEGHPDKVCDRVSDAILDACLALDSNARVAVETLVKGTSDQSYIVLAGEVTVAGGTPDYEAIARATVAEIGYTEHKIGMDATDPELTVVDVRITTQSPHIARGVTQHNLDQGAGDQGLMFGFACDETERFPELEGSWMPLPAHLSLMLTRKLTEVRADGTLPWARPDGKSQVTVEYDAKGEPMRVDTVVIAIQHDSELAEQFGGDIGAEQAHVKSEIRRAVIDGVIPSALMDNDTKVIVNGTGRFADPGGPYADAGITGRKIIVDTYGGMGRHGGGAFSGKDPSKVDRSAAYGARFAAKHVVASGLARRCEIQLAYAIGVAEPVSVLVDTFGSGVISDDEIASRVSSTFDFRPWAIIGAHDMLRPIFSPTAAGGHFGRKASDGFFPWESLNDDALRSLQA